MGADRPARRDRYHGTVMSVDEDGHLVPRRVTGWHATPLGGRSRLPADLSPRPSVPAASAVGIELTGDHPVLTERGYVPVGRAARRLTASRLAKG